MHPHPRKLNPLFVANVYYGVLFGEVELLLNPMRLVQSLPHWNVQRQAQPKVS